MILIRMVEFVFPTGIATWTASEYPWARVLQVPPHPAGVQDLNPLYHETNPLSIWRNNMCEHWRIIPTYKGMLQCLSFLVEFENYTRTHLNSPIPWGFGNTDVFSSCLPRLTAVPQGCCLGGRHVPAHHTYRVQTHFMHHAHNIVEFYWTLIPIAVQYLTHCSHADTQYV